MDTVIKLTEQIPEFLRIFEVSLRSGYNVRQCFEIISQDMAEPMGSEAQQVLNELEDGTSLPIVLDHWLAHAPSHDLDLVTAVIKVQLETGGNLADKFKLLSQILPKLQLAA